MLILVITAPCPSWGEWTTWGECNATCGGGKQISRRQCMNGDVGQDGCDGQVTKMRICNTAECPGEIFKHEISLHAAFRSNRANKTTKRT